MVSHGAVRTAEVTARFTLDALPGKQMAIDADLNAGLIDEQAARKRREAIAREAEFYGAMDGAARFNQRDSLATILITAINILAGLLIGVFQQNIALGEAVKTYTILTVGDGLVTMIPSLLVSVAGGWCSRGRPRRLPRWATRSARSFCAAAIRSGFRRAADRHGTDPRPPKLPFLMMAVGLGYMAYEMPARPDAGGKGDICARKLPEPNPPRARRQKISLRCCNGRSQLEIGFQLIPLVDEKQGGQMLARVRALRKSSGHRVGFHYSPVHITDNLASEAQGISDLVARCGDCALADGRQLICWPSMPTPRRGPMPGIGDSRTSLWSECALDSASIGRTSHCRRIFRRRSDHGHWYPSRRSHSPRSAGCWADAEIKRLLDSLSESIPS